MVESRSCVIGGGAWGLPGAFDRGDARLPAIRRAADADAGPADVGELAASKCRGWAGHDLDRFSRYGFDSV